MLQQKQKPHVIEASGPRQKQIAFVVPANLHCLRMLMVRKVKHQMLLVDH